MLSTLATTMLAVNNGPFSIPSMLNLSYAHLVLTSLIDQFHKLSPLWLACCRFVNSDRNRNRIIVAPCCLLHWRKNSLKKMSVASVQHSKGSEFQSLQHSNVKFSLAFDVHSIRSCVKFSMRDIISDALACFGLNRGLIDQHIKLRLIVLHEELADEIIGGFANQSN